MNKSFVTDIPPVIFNIINVNFVENIILWPLNYVYYSDGSKGQDPFGFTQLYKKIIDTNHKKVIIIKFEFVENFHYRLTLLSVSIITKN